jgi:hypothetical protein
VLQSFVFRRTISKFCKRFGESVQGLAEKIRKFMKFISFFSRFGIDVQFQRLHLSYQQQHAGRTSFPEAVINSPFFYRGILFGAFGQKENGRRIVIILSALVARFSEKTFFQSKQGTRCVHPQALASSRFHCIADGSTRRVLFCEMLTPPDFRKKKHCENCTR